MKSLHCIACGVLKELGRAGCDKCGECYRAGTAEWAKRHIANRPLQKEAQQAVVEAVRRGHMPPARVLMCVDCGKQAGVYDHRDYRRPLHVEPVCYSCNGKRGAAEPYRSGQAA